MRSTGRRDCRPPGPIRTTPAASRCTWPTSHSSCATSPTGAASSSKVARIDSLYTEALVRNPFIPPRLDRLLWEEAIDFASSGQSRLDRNRSGDAAYDAWMAFADGNLPEAVRLYDDALKRKPKDYENHSARGSAFYLMQQYDSAANELNLLLAEMRKRDEKKLVFF